MADQQVQEGSPAAGDRPCACGCNRTLNGLRSNARYATPACRTRDWKHRTGYTDQRARKASPRRHNVGRSGRQVSYRRAITELAAWIHLNWPNAKHPDAIAEHVLRQALPARQRDHERSVP